MVLASALASLIVPGMVRAQELLKEALASFPRDTIRVEFSSPSKLRALPNYVSLRKRYVGARLAQLETSLTDLGVVANDVDDLILGWRAGAGGELDLYGFATGRFNTATIAERATARGLAPEVMSGKSAYCLQAGLAGNCVIILGNSLGAFGTLGSLSSLLDAREGRAPALGAEERFTRLLKGAQTGAPIWGVAIGPAASDWFKGWMPGQGGVQLDWAKVFEPVEALAYSIQAGDKVSLDLKLDCSTADAASGLRQILDGLKLAQQVVWQNQNPGKPNPFEAMEVGLSDRQVSLKLTAAYAALEGVTITGAQ